MLMELTEVNAYGTVLTSEQNKVSIFITDLLELNEQFFHLSKSYENQEKFKKQPCTERGLAIPQ